MLKIEDQSNTPNNGDVSMKSSIELEQGNIGDKINEILPTSEKLEGINSGYGFNIGGINYLSENQYGNIKVLKNSEGLFFFFDISKSEFLFEGKGFENFEGFISEHGKFGSFNDDKYLYLMDFGNISYKKISIYNLQHNIESAFLEKLDHGDVYYQMSDYLEYLPNGNKFYFDAMYVDNNNDLIIPFNYNGIYLMYNFNKGNLLNGNIFLSDVLASLPNLAGIKSLGKYFIIPGLTYFNITPQGFSDDFNDSMKTLNWIFLVIDGGLYYIDFNKKNVGIFDFETGEIDYGEKFTFDQKTFSYLPVNIINRILDLLGKSKSKIKTIKYSK